MKKVDISTFMYVIILVIIYFLGTSNCLSQEFITNNNFSDKIAKDITVVEFWAGWNESNQFNELNKLNDCNTYRIDIMTYMDVQIDYNVTAIPTIIIFDNGVEKTRFKRNIMFQLEANKKIVQHSVDTITLNKFQ